MTDYELLRLRVRLAIAKEIAQEFRPNTTLETIIKEYEARVAHHEKRNKEKPHEPIRGC